MEWPAYSLNLNPIEYIWDYLWRQIRGADNPPTTLEELEEALARMWLDMTVDFRIIIQRCQDVIQAHTRY